MLSAPRVASRVSFFTVAGWAADPPGLPMDLPAAGEPMPRGMPAAPEHPMFGKALRSIHYSQLSLCLNNSRFFGILHKTPAQLIGKGNAGLNSRNVRVFGRPYNARYFKRNRFFVVIKILQVLDHRLTQKECLSSYNIHHWEQL